MAYVCTISLKDEVNCLVTGISKDVGAKLKKLLTFVVPGSFHMPAYKLGKWDGKVSLFTDGWTFTNLIDDDFLAIIEDAGYEIEFKDERESVGMQCDPISDTEFSDLPGSPVLRDYQVAAVNTALSLRSGIFRMATGAGKSYVCAAVARRMMAHGRVAVIVPSISLVMQTADSFRALGITDVGEFSGVEKRVANVTITTWQSLANFPEILEGVVCVIADECFAAGTMILNGDRKYVPIETMRIGDSVVAYDIVKRRFGIKTITNVHEQFPLTSMYELEFDNGRKLKVTGNHEFFTKNRGWVAASDLDAEDDIVEMTEKSRVASLNGAAAWKGNRRDALKSKMKGRVSPFKGRKHPNHWAKGHTKETHPSLLQLSEKRRGNANPASKASMKYPAIGRIRQSETMRKRFADGSISPNINNRNRCIVVNGIKFRSTWEAIHHMVHPSHQYETLRIGYFDDFGKRRTSIVDFVDHVNKLAIEVKPRKLLEGAKYSNARRSITKWCAENGYLYIEEDETVIKGYLTDEIIKALGPFYRKVSRL